MNSTTIKLEIKHLLKRSPQLFRVVKELSIAWKILYSKTRSTLRQMSGILDEELLQSSPVYVTNQIPKFESYDQLASIFKERSLSYFEGKHTIYLPPQPGLYDTIGDIVHSYPDDAGFKILKRFSKPENARYLNESNTKLIHYLLEGIDTQALAAACLSALDLGPKLYDIAQLTATDVDLTVMISQHSAGHPPDMDEYSTFLSILKNLARRGVFRLANPSGFDCGDFSPPDCNANLIVTSENRFRYIDPQLFLFDRKAVLDTILSRSEADLHFGTTSKLIKNDQKFLYQEIPGLSRFAKRETGYRWNLIRTIFEKHGVGIAGKVIFDVCCNSGMISAYCLAHQAKWAIGWDLPEVASAAEKITAVLGVRRFQGVGCRLSDIYDLTADVPQWLHRHTRGSILFFLSAWQHIGFPSSIRHLPWEWLVYEGHQNDAMDQTRSNVERIQRDWNCTQLHSETCLDGTCSARPVILFHRS